MTGTSSLLPIVLRLLEGARGLARDFGEDQVAEVDDERVTDVSTLGDRALARYFADALRSSLPTASLWSEEGGALASAQADLTVLVDEIDGTDNFARGREILPWCSVMTIFRGTAPRFGDALAAGIVEHRSGIIWTAEPGGGAWERRPGKEPRRLPPKTKEARPLPGLDKHGFDKHGFDKHSLDRRSLILVDLYSARGGAARLGALSERAWLKDFGSSAFHGALLASARAEAYVNLAHKTHELGAIMLLAKESGAAIGLLDGSPLEDQPVSLDGTHPIVAARSPEMLEKIRELMV